MHVEPKKEYQMSKILQEKYLIIHFETSKKMTICMVVIMISKT